ncbi:MAG: hypothetical protein ABIQ18_39375 [Umezawaea sp.]
MNSMSKRISRSQAIFAMPIAWQGSWQASSANQAGQAGIGSPM